MVEVSTCLTMECAHFTHKTKIALSSQLDYITQNEAMVSKIVSNPFIFTKIQPTILEEVYSEDYLTDAELVNWLIHYKSNPTLYHRLLKV